MQNVGSDNVFHYKEYACKMLVQIMHLTIKNANLKIAKQLSYYFSFYHPQRREKCQTEKIAFKNRVVIFLLMLKHYLHNTA